MRLELIPKAVEDSQIFLAEHADALARFARVTELVEGFETPFGMELLASVHWVAVNGASDADAATQALYAWNVRKKQFTSEHVALAHQRLARKGWLEATA